MYKKINKQKLLHYYVKKYYSVNKCSLIMKCSVRNILRELVRFKTKLRSQSEAQLGQRICRKYNIDKNFLYNAYVKNGLSAKHISKSIGCSEWVIYRSLREMNITVKKSSDYPVWHKGIFGVLIGKKAFNWNGGLSFEPYSVEFNNILKSKIRKRDKNICKLCNKRKYGKELSVHHIDYNKKNCKEDNLISLHRGCNTKVNKSRDYWFAYFNFYFKARKK